MIKKNCPLFIMMMMMMIINYDQYVRITSTIFARQIGQWPDVCHCFTEHLKHIQTCPHV